MSDLHDRLKRHIRRAGYDYKSLSLAIGQGERYISNLLGSKSDPGFSTVVRICSVLGITPNQLAGLDDRISFSPRAACSRGAPAPDAKTLASLTRSLRHDLSRHGARPRLDDVLSWWHQQGGQLTNFEGLSPYVDLYRAPAPDARMPDLHRMGERSLASIAFKVNSAEHMRRLFAKFDPGLMERVTAAHAMTQRGDPKLSVEELDVALPDHSFPLRFKYKRLLLPVRDARGNQYTLNFSQALE